MTQSYEKPLEIKSQEIKVPEFQIPIKKEMDDLLGDLNPRYFEEGYSLKEGKIRAEISRIGPDFNSSFFGGY
ncbi:MAG: hypothetical protein ACXAAH_14665 [Promethearchaeota archaeon]|jgi:hypothetical protein